MHPLKTKWSKCGIFKQGIPVVFECGINKTKKNRCRHSLINNLSSATCFGFVSHLQAEYTVVVCTVYSSAVSGVDEILS